MCLTIDMWSKVIYVGIDSGHQSHCYQHRGQQHCRGTLYTSCDNEQRTNVMIHFLYLLLAVSTRALPVPLGLISPHANAFASVQTCLANLPLVPLTNAPLKAKKPTAEVSGYITIASYANRTTCDGNPYNYFGMKQSFCYSGGMYILDNSSYEHDVLLQYRIITFNTLAKMTILVNWSTSLSRCTQPRIAQAQPQLRVGYHFPKILVITELFGLVPPAIPRGLVQMEHLTGS